MTGLESLRDAEVRQLFPSIMVGYPVYSVGTQEVPVMLKSSDICKMRSARLSTLSLTSIHHYVTVISLKGDYTDHIIIVKIL